MLQLSYKTTILLHYIYGTLSWLHFLAPIFSLYFLSFGLTELQMTFVTITIFMITAAIFEVPSGIFADRIGRKKTLVISMFLAIICLILYIIGSSYSLFIIGAIVNGLSVSMVSGTATSMLYDYLLQYKKEKEYKKIRGNQMMIGLIGLGTTSALGGYLFSITPRLPFILSTAFLIIGLLVLLLIEEPRYIKAKNTKEIVGMSLQFLKMPFVWWVTGLSLFITIIFLYARSIFQIHLQDVGASVVMLGILYAVFRFVASAGSKSSHAIAEKLGLKRSLFFGMLCIILSFFVLTFTNLLFSIVFIGALYFLLNYLIPIREEYENRHVVSAYRATFASVISLNSKVLQAILGLVIGYLIGLYNVQFTYFAIACLLSVVFIVLVFTYREKWKITQHKTI